MHKTSGLVLSQHFSCDEKVHPCHFYCYSLSPQTSLLFTPWHTPTSSLCVSLSQVESNSWCCSPLSGSSSLCVGLHQVESPPVDCTTLWIMFASQTSHCWSSHLPRPPLRTRALLPVVSLSFDLPCVFLLNLKYHDSFRLVFQVCCLFF